MIDNALCIQPLTSTAAVFPEKFDSSSSTVTRFTGGNCSKPEIPILNRNSHFKYKYLDQTYGQTVGDQTGRRCSRINKQRSNARKVAHLPLGPGSRSTHHLIKQLKSLNVVILNIYSTCFVQGYYPCFLLGCSAIKDRFPDIISTTLSFLYYILGDFHCRFYFPVGLAVIR